MFSHASTESWYIRSRKGVAANVAASASSKTQPVPISTQLTTSGRASTCKFSMIKLTKINKLISGLLNFINFY